MFPRPGVQQGDGTSRGIIQRLKRIFLCGNNVELPQTGVESLKMKCFLMRARLNIHKEFTVTFHFFHQFEKVE